MRSRSLHRSTELWIGTGEPQGGRHARRREHESAAAIASNLLKRMPPGGGAASSVRPCAQKVPRIAV